jgi:hypothetical protein
MDIEPLATTPFATSSPTPGTFHEAFKRWTGTFRQRALAPAVR